MLKESDSALPPPQRFGRYEVVRRVGRGAMGELLEGRHVDLGTRVAIKVVHADVTLDEAAARRVLREGRATAAIRHPHVVTVLDVGDELGRPFLVMELLEGEDLAQRLAKGGLLSAQEAADLLLPVASALAAAHAAGVVHRDLKPSNVFLARRHDRVDPVVVDFGISKSPRLGAETTSSQCMAGTPQYMAPERFRVPHDATSLSDQYALGILLYECVTGGTPFSHEHYYDLLQSIMTAPIVAPSELNPQVPKALDSVVLRALARDPKARFSSVRGLGAALLPFASVQARRKWGPEMTPSSAEGGVEIAGEDERTPEPGHRRLLKVAGLTALLSAALLAASLSAKQHDVPSMTTAAAAASASEVAPVSHPPASTEPTPGLDSVTGVPVTPATVVGIAPATSTSRPRLPLARPSPLAPSRRPTVPARPTSNDSVGVSPEEGQGPPATVERGTRNIPIVE
jgi:tRNA A-37 threonylcarbamoyl transferase component Bud32